MRELHAVNERGSHMTMSDFRQGFENLEQETLDQPLQVQGTLPAWLHGVLFRTGPALFSLKGGSYDHWFDGLAMIQRFAFGGGAARYAGRFLQSPDYQKSTALGRPATDEFMSVPQRGLLERLWTLFDPERQFGRNGMVNVLRVGNGRMLALTENPLPMEFDPADGSTVGPFDWPDDVQSVLNMITTAHTWYDPELKTTWNFLVHINPLAPKYLVTRLDDGQTARKLVAQVATDLPSYMHSFALTRNFIVLTEFPLVTSCARLITMPLTGSGYIDTYRWQPERGTRFTVINKLTGAQVGTWSAEAFFAFHHVNAWEEDDCIVMDISVYDDGPAIIEHLRLESLRAPGGGTLPWSGMVRYRLPLGGGPITHRRLSPVMLEMPQINLRDCTAQPYRYVYGVSWTEPGQFVNALVKLDVDTGRHIHWHQPDCWPGEPVFAPAPEGDEDAGVNLSIVFDAHAGRSFILVLDATSFTELARMELPVAIPFMLHGTYYPGPVEVKA